MKPLYFPDEVRINGINYQFVSLDRDEFEMPDCETYCDFYKIEQLEYCDGDPYVCRLCIDLELLGPENLFTILEEVK